MAFKGMKKTFQTSKKWMKHTPKRLSIGRKSRNFGETEQVDAMTGAVKKKDPPAELLETSSHIASSPSEDRVFEEYPSSYESVSSGLPEIREMEETVGLSDIREGTMESRDDDELLVREHIAVLMTKYSDDSSTHQNSVPERYLTNDPPSVASRSRRSNRSRAASHDSSSKASRSRATHASSKGNRTSPKGDISKASGATNRKEDQGEHGMPITISIAEANEVANENQRDHGLGFGVIELNNSFSSMYSRVSMYSRLSEAFGLLPSTNTEHEDNPLDMTAEEKREQDDTEHREEPEQEDISHQEKEPTDQEEEPTHQEENESTNLYTKVCEMFGMNQETPSAKTEVEDNTAVVYQTDIGEEITLSLNDVMVASNEADREDKQENEDIVLSQNDVWDPSNAEREDKHEKDNVALSQNEIAVNPSDADLAMQNNAGDFGQIADMGEGDKQENKVIAFRCNDVDNQDNLEMAFNMLTGEDNRQQEQATNQSQDDYQQKQSHQDSDVESAQGSTKFLADILTATSCAASTVNSQRDFESAEDEDTGLEVTVDSFENSALSIYTTESKAAAGSEVQNLQAAGSRSSVESASKSVSESVSSFDFLRKATQAKKEAQRLEVEAKRLEKQQRLENMKNKIEEARGGVVNENLLGNEKKKIRTELMNLFE